MNTHSSSSDRREALVPAYGARSDSPSGSFRMSVGALLVLSALMYFPALGAPGILNTTDSYYAEAAREMLNRGDFITPYLNFAPYYFKPILTYWLIIASYLAFGINTFASRLPSALSCIATVIALYALTRNYIGQKPALLAALALVSMPLFAVVGHISLPDTQLVLLVTITNLLLLGTLIGGSSRGLIPAYVCLGLAVLCKGPLAIAFVATCVGGFLLVSSASINDFKQRFFLLKPWLGLAILLAVALPWFAAIHIASNGAFTQFFFIQQNFGRLSGQFQSHNLPVWFYIPYLIGGFLPWLPILLSAPAVLRPDKEKRTSKNPRVQLTIASCCWLFGTLALLTVSSSKVAHYLLPIAPPIAILAGLYLETVLKLGRRRFILWVAPAMAIGGVVCLFVLAKVFESSPDLRMIALTFVSMQIAGYIAYGAFIVKSRLKTGVILLYAWSILASGLMVPVALQQTYREGNEGFQFLVKKATRLDSGSLAVRSNECPAAVYYGGKQVYEVESPQDCYQFLATTKGPHYFIFDSKTVELLRPVLPGSQRIIESKGKWNLLQVDGPNEQTK